MSNKPQLYHCVHLNNQSQLKSFLETSTISEAKPFYYESQIPLEEHSVCLVENANGLVPAYVITVSNLTQDEQDALKIELNLQRWRQVVGVIDTTLASQLLTAGCTSC